MTKELAVVKRLEFVKPCVSRRLKVSKQSVDNSHRIRSTKLNICKKNGIVNDYYYITIISCQEKTQCAPISTILLVVVTNHMISRRHEPSLCQPDSKSASQQVAALNWTLWQACCWPCIKKRRTDSYLLFIMVSFLVKISPSSLRLKPIFVSSDENVKKKCLLMLNDNVTDFVIYILDWILHWRNFDNWFWVKSIKKPNEKRKLFFSKNVKYCVTVCIVKKVKTRSVSVRHLGAELSTNVMISGEKKTLSEWRQDFRK